MDPLQRLRYVTQRYPDLQGLRLIPLAVPFLMSAAWRAGYLRWVPGTTGRGPQHWFAIVFVVALVGATALGSYYRRRFGVVQPLSRIRGLFTALTSLAAFAFAIWLQSKQPHTLSLPLLVIAASIGYAGVLDGLPRTHYLAVSASCLALGMLCAGTAPQTRVVLRDALTGIGLIVIGLGDHLLIRRTLQPAPHVHSL